MEPRELIFSDFLGQGSKMIVIAHIFKLIELVILFKLSGCEVNIDLFLIKIREAEVDIHIKGQALAPCIPEKVIKSVRIFAPEKHLAVDTRDIVEADDKRNSPVLLAVFNIIILLIGTKIDIRTDCRVGQ